MRRVEANLAHDGSIELPLGATDDDRQGKTGHNTTRQDKAKTKRRDAMQEDKAQGNGKTKQQKRRHDLIRQAEAKKTRHDVIKAGRDQDRTRQGKR